jgi:hypothetical protein
MLEPDPLRIRGQKRAQTSRRNIAGDTRSHDLGKKQRAGFSGVREFIGEYEDFRLIGCGFPLDHTLFAEDNMSAFGM